MSFEDYDGKWAPLVRIYLPSQYLPHYLLIPTHLITLTFPSNTHPFDTIICTNITNMTHPIELGRPLNWNEARNEKNVEQGGILNEEEFWAQHNFVVVVDDDGANVSILV